MKFLPVLVLLATLSSGYNAKTICYTQNQFEYAPVVATEAGEVRGVVEVTQSGDKVLLYQGIKFGMLISFCLNVSF